MQTAWEAQALQRLAQNCQPESLYHVPKARQAGTAIGIKLLPKNIGITHSATSTHTTTKDISQIGVAMPRSLKIAERILNKLDYRQKFHASIVP
jgi:hypothetical protein